jgi:hypothetical protein
MRDCGGGEVQAGAAAKQQFMRGGLAVKLSASRVKSAQRAAVLLILVGAFAATVLAQQSPGPPEPSQSPEPSNPDQTKPEQPSLANQAASAAMKPVELFNMLEKKSIVFPDIARNTIALSPMQKFELFVDDSVSVDAFVESTLGSLIGQAEDSPTGYGVGGMAYMKRFGSSLARESSANFFGTFVIASALHEDPRFFPEYKPTLKGSVKYSAKNVFVIRNDAGREVANMPVLLGSLLSEGLANAYWPDRNRTVGDTLLRYGIDLGERMAGNIFRDYWPVISAKVSRAATSHKGSK